jgi:hypothetical protein
LGQTSAAAIEEKSRIALLCCRAVQTVKGPDRSRALPDKEDTMRKIVLQLILIGIVLLLVHSTPAY